MLLYLVYPAHLGHIPMTVALLQLQPWSPAEDRPPRTAPKKVPGQPTGSPGKEKHKRVAR